MMTVKEYAIDVNKSVSDILQLCKKLNISAQDENYDLSEDDIILLDGEVSNDIEDEDVYSDDEEILDDDQLEKDYKLKEDKDESEIKMKKKQVVIKKDDTSKYQKAK